MTLQMPAHELRYQICSQMSTTTPPTLPVTAVSVIYRLMRSVQNVDTLDWSTTLCSYALLMRARLCFMSAPPASKSCAGLALSLFAAGIGNPHLYLLFSGTSTLRILDSSFGEQHWHSLQEGSEAIQQPPAFSNWHS